MMEIIIQDFELIKLCYDADQLTLIFYVLSYVCMYFLNNL